MLKKINKIELFLGISALVFLIIYLKKSNTQSDLIDIPTILGDKSDLSETLHILTNADTENLTNTIVTNNSLMTTKQFFG